MIKYQTTLDSIAPDKLTGFFVGWPHPPSPEVLFQVLKNSGKIVLAIDTDSGHMIGFINAITDNVLSAYIPLLEVLPEYQKKGIGAELVKRMLKELGDLYMIDLACDRELNDFYQKFGFTNRNAQIIRNFHVLQKETDS